MILLSIRISRMKGSISIRNSLNGKHGDLKLLILACAVMEREILNFKNARTTLKFFDYGLHQTPEKMAQALQTEIDRASEKEDYDGIVLGYGLCSNGIVGVHCKKEHLIIPRIHDCITLFLGSSEAYRKQSAEHPGTYYLTPGWIEKGETPISKYHSYAQSHGEETARWVLHEELKHYTRVALINAGGNAIEHYREIARQNAEFLGIAYQEIPGSPLLFKELVCGPWEEEFIVLERGRPVRQGMFLDL